MKNIVLLVIASVLMYSGNVYGQTDTTINGVSYTLFAPGLWVEVEGSGPSYPSGTVHCGDPTEVVEVTSTTGKVWMDRNLGASQVATSSTDAASYGDLYQWGRAADGHQCRNSETTNTQSNTDQPGHGDFIIEFADWRSPQNTNLWQGVNGVNNPCPEGYRVPTEAEWQDEIDSWGGGDFAANAFASPLKFPMAGSRASFDGVLFAFDVAGLFWSSTFSSTNSMHLFFSSDNTYVSANLRALGFSVRCLKD